MKVSIIMGSISDYEKAKKAIGQLEDFKVDYEVRVISAHRALDDLISYVDGFEERSIGVCIAIAGKAAHLPGVIAGMTTLPVIGVPISSQATAGMDALLSIVQMPTGVPVATVALDGCANASILASQILALSDQELKKRLEEHKKEMLDKVRQQNEEL